jgi:phosphatidylserine/phosphatidylglycerophosphate/cardiolipin synthase-like enzyme
MANLQHNKFIVVKGVTNTVVCGSTNFSWRGFFVQANNAVTLRGVEPVALFSDAFDHYWNGTAAAFKSTASADWQPVTLVSVTPDVTFSPHSSSNAKMPEIVTAINGTQSSLFYSLAFLYLSPPTPAPGAVDLVAAIDSVVSDSTKFVYGMSDHDVAGLDVRKPNGNLAIVSPGALQENVPEPFKSEPIGGSGTRLHHKFVVIDFDTDNATVYLGSHNLSKNADTKNGENLLRIRDRRIATSYMIEALRLFDHYHFRAIVEELNEAGTPLTSLRLKKPPRAAGEVPWFDEYYDDPQKVRDRTLFA